MNLKKFHYRKPLLLKGVRQTRKTGILKEFGKRYYENTVYPAKPPDGPELPSGGFLLWIKWSIGSLEAFVRGGSGTVRYAFQGKNVLYKKCMFQECRNNAAVVSHSDAL